MKPVVLVGEKLIVRLSHNICDGILPQSITRVEFYSTSAFRLRQEH